MARRAEQIVTAQEQLAQSDKVLEPIIARVGGYLVKPQRDTFQVLVRSIVSQQISTAAARTILNRLIEHLQPGGITPAALAGLDLQQFRSLGISQQKASYLQDLTAKVQNGQLELKKLSRQADEVVVAELVRVKGIGVWTAHMFMIFALGRLDVLPVGDLGVRSAIQRRYGLVSLPGASEIESIARPWRPYASVASWYLWRSLELDKVG